MANPPAPPAQQLLHDQVVPALAGLQHGAAAQRVPVGGVRSGVQQQAHTGRCDKGAGKGLEQEQELLVTQAQMQSSYVCD